MSGDKKRTKFQQDFVKGFTGKDIEIVPVADKDRRDSLANREARRKRREARKKANGGKL